MHLDIYKVVPSLVLLLINNQHKADAKLIFETPSKFDSEARKDDCRHRHHSWQ
jgi:hypothetical protein